MKKTLLIVVVITTAFIWLAIQDKAQIRETKKFTCDTIRENGEYIIGELEEAGCLNLDYLNTL